MNRMHHRILAAVGAAGLAATTLGMTGAAQAAPPANPYVNHANGQTSTYQVVYADQTWPEARDAAAAMPAPAGCASHLAVITSQEEEDYIEQSFPYPDFNTNAAWLGAKRSDATDAGKTAAGDTAVGDFAWITGEAFDYDNWNGGEPNNASPGEPFMDIAINFRWNDIFANFVGPSSIVETECTPSGLQVTEVDPGTGFPGDTVTIYGSGFNAPGPKSVVFGAKKSPSINVVNDYTIEAVVPAPGKPVTKAKAVDVQVKIKNKKSAKTSADKFTYQPESNNT